MAILCLFSFPYSVSDGTRHSFVENAWQYFFYIWLFNQKSQIFCCLQEHIVFELFYAIIKRPAENSGKRQNIVYLIRKIGPSCRHDKSSCLLCNILHYFRNRIRHSE